MDIFDQFLFEEITSLYSKSDRSSCDYEEIYQRFLYLDHLPEVKPYLLAMKYLGLGTPASPDTVLDELSSLLSEGNSCICGLYYDLMLFKDENNSEIASKMNAMADGGYLDVYLKDYSHLRAKNRIKSANNKESVFPALEALSRTNESAPPKKIQYKWMSFECCDYDGVCSGLSGLYFTTDDTAYIRAKVFIEPIKHTRKLKIRSQIYSGDKPFSKTFCDEFILQPGNEWFTTTGWGNKNFNCYGAGIYEWRIEIDGEDVYSQTFRMYRGKLVSSGVRINSLKLFASKSNGALESDRENYKTAFDGQKLEYAYFKVFIDPPGDDIAVQFFIKVICLEDNSVIYDKYILQPLRSDCVTFWNGIGFSAPGKWNKGLYQYSVRIGNGPAQERTFTVY